MALAALLPHHHGGARDGRRAKREGGATRCRNAERRRHTMNETPVMFSGLDAQGEINGLMSK